MLSLRSTAIPSLLKLLLLKSTLAAKLVSVIYSGWLGLILSRACRPGAGRDARLSTTVWQSDASRPERSFASQEQNKRPCEEQTKPNALSRFFSEDVEFDVELIRGAFEI